MEPNKQLFHQFIDDCFDGWLERRQPVVADTAEEATPEPAFEKPTADTPTPNIAEPAPLTTPEVPKKVEHNPDERVVRTKATGDKVYLINDKELTKRWITKAEVLEGLGWSFNDVVEIPDMDLAKYKPVSAVTSA